MSTGFSVSNGQILTPSGQVFIAHGVNVIEGNSPTAAQLQADFPGINFVRLAIYDYASPQSLASYVNSLTSAGIVVELEDHNNGAGSAGGSAGTIFTGQALTTELNWYSSIGSYFANNPYVWFGTNNEPSEVNPSTGQNDPAALSTWQQQTYQAVRNAGNSSPVMLEVNSGGTTATTDTGYVASDYAGMTNAVWDIHYYGWLSGYSTNQSTVSNTLSTMISAAQQITSANGTIPVIIGEYGNSTGGTNIDPNANQVIAAVAQSGVGSVAWAVGPVNQGDSLMTAWGSTTLTSYGTQIAAMMPGTFTPVLVGSSGAASAQPASANDTVVTASSGGTITDASGNAWTIAAGVVQQNGKAAGYSSGVTEIAYVNSTVWQENAAGLWWSWSGTSWGTSAGTSTSPLPATSASGSTVTAGSAAAITDASGNAWTISGGVVLENGKAAGYSANVTELAYVNGTIWQENASKLWWSWNGTAWPGNGTATSPLPAATTPTPAPTPPAATAPSGSGAATFSLANGALAVVLGSGPDTLSFLQASGMSIAGGSGTSNLTISGATTVTVGTGAMTVTEGAAGADAYVVQTGSGALTIADFSAGKGDTIQAPTYYQATTTTGSDGAGGTLISFGIGVGAVDLRGYTGTVTLAYH